MMKVFVPTLCAAVLTTVTMAYEPAPAAPAPAPALPCEVVVTPPTTPIPNPNPTPTTPKPTAPQNLRILGGGGSLAELEAEELEGSGPFVPEPAAYAAPAPVPQTTHSYYLSLASRADCIRAYSLRDPAQLQNRANGGFAQNNSTALMVTYDPANDPDPRRQDAAKVIIGTGSNSLTNQVRLPIPKHSPESLFVTWDAWYGDEFAFNITGIDDYKTFQFGSPANDIHMEIRNRFAMSPSTAGILDGRLYPEGGYSQGPNVTFPDTLAPRVGTYHIPTETWVRYFAYFKAPAAGGTWYEYSLWAADANTGPVLIYDRLQVRPSPQSSTAAWEAFWLEFNTSTSLTRSKATRPQLVAYVRNVVMLKAVANVAPLLVKP